MILCEFTYYEKLNEYVELNSKLNATSFIPNNRTYNYISINKVKAPSWIEYLLVYWMFAFMMEECRQVDY